jgi:hypothetical protein
VNAESEQQWHGDDDVLAAVLKAQIQVDTEFAR